MLYEDLEDGYVQTSLGKIHFKKTVGPGEKVIFLHGAGANTRAFKRLVEILPVNIEAYLVDLLGHGDSEAPSIAYTVENQTLAIREFIEKVGAEQSYLFGNSYGGWIAALIAQDNHIGKGIILEDAVGLKEYFDDISRSLTPDEYREKLIKDLRFLSSNRKVIESMIDSEKTTASYLTRESLANVSKPTLIIWGENDTTVDVKYASLFNDYIKGSKLEIVKGAGHVPHFTHPDKVKELLLAFITR